jgi:hypothetical protein
MARSRRAGGGSREPAPLEWKPIETQVSPPDERSCGIVVEGAHAVCGDQLHVRDHEGKSWRVALKPGDNPDILARKLLREKFGKHHAFNQSSPFTTLLEATIRRQFFSNQRQSKENPGLHTAGEKVTHHK